MGIGTKKYLLIINFKKLLKQNLIIVIVFLFFLQQIWQIDKKLLLLMARQKSGLFGHSVKDALAVFEQCWWRIELNNSAGVQHHDFGAVHDRVDPVSDGEHGAVGKLFPDGGLVQVVEWKKLLLWEKWEVQS